MAEAKSERLELRLEPSLLALVDRARGDVSRAQFVRKALLNAVGAGPEDTMTVVNEMLADLEPRLSDLDRRMERLESMAQGASY